MSLIIDGYNLLNATGIVGSGVGRGGLERSRLALLNFLADWLPPAELPRTVVVFDATHTPPGLPKVVGHRGLVVRFAPRNQDADTLIEELIRADTSPRRLTVVSSDHRVQRAARRRRARAVDSDVWFGELVSRRRAEAEQPPTAVRPALPLSEDEVARWLDEFAGPMSREAESLRSGEGAAPDVRDAERPDAEPPPAEEPEGPPENPFPPGYGEDLLDEE